MDDPTTTLGVLVVDETGSVSWWSARATAVPSAELAVAPGIILRIDPVRPGEPLGWIVEREADAAPLAAAFGDPRFAVQLDEIRGRGETVHAFDSPGLTTPWTRRASVAAAVRWTMRPVHNGALLLDKAVTAHIVGLDAVAKHSFRHANYALLEFGHRCVEGKTAGSTATLVRRALACAEAAGIGDEITDLLRLTEDAEPIDDGELLAALATWSEGIAEMETEVLIGDVVPSESTPNPELLDLTVIAPRVITWRGRNSAELRIEYRREDSVFVLTAALADGVDPLCEEARELLGYSADIRTGALIAVAPARATGRSIVAEIPARARTASTLTFGLFGAGADVDALRCDPIGRALATVDRAMIEAWNLHRTAVTTLSATAASADPDTVLRSRIRCDEQLMLARAAAAQARGLLAALLDTMADGEQRIIRALTARSAAIEAYIEQLWDPTPVAVEELTLLDLIPPDSDEI